MTGEGRKIFKIVHGKRKGGNEEDVDVDEAGKKQRMVLEDVANTENISMATVDRSHRSP